MKTLERRWAAIAVAAVLATGGLTSLSTANADAATCGERTMPVYQAVHP